MVFLNLRPSLLFRLLLVRLTIQNWSLQASKLQCNILSGAKQWMKSLRLFKDRVLGCLFLLIPIIMLWDASGFINWNAIVMAPSIVTKPDLWQKASINNLVWTLMKRLAMSLSHPLWWSIYLLLSSSIGPWNSLMYKMPSCMVISKRMFTWSIPLVMLIPESQTMSVNFENLSMVWNRPHVPGLRDFLLNFFTWGLNLLRLTHLYLFFDNKILVYLLVYVDDIILTSNSPVFLQSLIA